MSKYRRSITSDLHEVYGIDLDEELGEGRYGWLLERILDLPDPYSRFREAMSDDDEMAEVLLDIEEERDQDDAEPTRLRYSQVGFREMVMISIDQTLKAMRAEAPVIHRATKKKKPDYPDPWPMPQTAVQRLRARRDKQAVERLAIMFGVHPDDL